MRSEDAPSRGAGSLSLALQGLAQGQPDAEDRFFGLVYPELRKVARAQLRRDARSSMESTSLVHEAFMRLAGNEQVVWENRRHFFGAAIRAMQQILIEHARKRNAIRRGGNLKRVDLGEHPAHQGDVLDQIMLRDTINALRERSSRQALVVEYRYYLGFSGPQVAAELSVSPRTVDTDWKHAKAWIRRAMTAGA